MGTGYSHLSYCERLAIADGLRDGDRANGGSNSQDDQTGSAGYVAHVALGSISMLTEGGPVELGPGMSVTAEIKTGQRRVISYLLSPIARYRQESMRER